MLNALEALTALQAQMPGWLEKAESLRSSAHAKYNEFTKLSENMDRPPSLRKRKGSTESLRPQDDGEKVPSTGDTPILEPVLPLSASAHALQTTIPTTPAQCSKINIDPRNRHLFREVREQRRKRKNPSLKDGQSGPQKVRARLSLVIYYDSSIQEGFETLVKNISGARNVLRKARTAVSLRPKWTSMKPEESPFGRQGAYAYRTSTVPRLGLPQGNILAESKTGLEVYDQLDKDFEAAQTLCEVGAHQALRDGDCFEELADVKAHFVVCLKLIDEEVANLKKQDEEIRIMRESGVEIEHSLVVEGAATKPEPSVFDSNDPSAVAVDGPIEADTEETASIVVDLSELPGRRQYSSKHQNKSRTSSSSAAQSSQDSSFLRTTSPATPDAPSSGQIEDKNLKYTRLGAHVPLEHATAMAAASIAVGEATAPDEPDLNLSAMRTSIPRRRPEQPSVAIPAALTPVEAIAEEPAFDFSAMRKMAMKRRGPPGPSPGTKDVNEKLKTTSDASTKMPNLAIDSSFSNSPNMETEKNSLAIDPACGLRDMRRAQVA